MASDQVQGRVFLFSYIEIEMPTPENKTQNTEEVAESPTREITQTDHLNKKLLTSLFKRMDEGGDSQLSKMLESDNKTEEDDDWKD